MSVVLPTVRVANPNILGTYMVINQSDFADHHELWPEQAAGYVAPAARAEDAVEVAQDLATLFGREVASSMRVFGKLMAKQLGYTPEQWTAMTPDQRADLVEAEEPKIDAAVAASSSSTPVQETETSKPASAPAAKPSWKGGK